MPTSTKKVNNGILNNYTIKPRNLTQYTAFRGVTDFSQIGQFDQYESGYHFLSVIQMPPFMTKLGEVDTNSQAMVNSFKQMLEYEFRGLDGLPDITTETMTITDGINEQQLINKVVSDTSVTISSNYFEKKGSLITKFSEYYLTGIKDKNSQAKTYHGLIKNNLMEPNPENEVFTMLYYVTDNTMLRLEKAVLLANCQLTKAETSIYNGQKGQYDNKELSIEWNCFPITGVEVDKAAKVLLQDITGVMTTSDKASTKFSVVKDEGVAVLDTAEFKYGIMNDKSPSKIASLVDAIGRSTTDADDLAAEEA